MILINLQLGYSAPQLDPMENSMKCSIFFLSLDDCLRKC